MSLIYSPLIFLYYLQFFDRQRLFTTIFNPTRLANGEGSTLGTLIFDIELVSIRHPWRRLSTAYVCLAKEKTDSIHQIICSNMEVQHIGGGGALGHRIVLLVILGLLMKIDNFVYRQWSNSKFYHILKWEIHDTNTEYLMIRRAIGSSIRGLINYDQ